jgi:hypothetical protein
MRTIRVHRFGDPEVVARAYPPAHAASAHRDILAARAAGKRVLIA